MYRCVCIYETYSSPRRLEVRIEVCQGSHTKSLSPFIRKVDVDTLAQNCVPESKPLLPLMNQMGMIKQPFRLSGMVLENGQHPAVLKDMVCSPAGTTIEGVAALEKNNFRNAVIEAVTAACDRSIALGK